MMKQMRCIRHSQQFEKAKALVFWQVKDNLPYASLYVRPPGSQYEPGKKRGVILAGLADSELHLCLHR
jgi:hypothetical protein